MLNNMKLFVKIACEVFNFEEPICEIGALQVPGQEGYANLRSFFLGKHYIGCDLRAGVGVDRIENVESLSMADSSVGTILMLSTLEHVENCYKAMEEGFRVLKKNGMVIMTSVMHFPIHSFPDDYWRFTPSGFKYLLKKFPIKIIGTQGALEFPHTIFGIGFKREQVEDIRPRFEELKFKFLNEFSLKKQSIKQKMFNWTLVSLGLDKKYPSLRRTLSINEIKMDLYYGQEDGR